MRILVTGGAGFIGSHLTVRLVRARHRVAVLDDCSTGEPGNLAELRRQVLALLAQFADGSIELLRYVGLLGPD